MRRNCVWVFVSFVSYFLFSQFNNNISIIQTHVPCSSCSNVCLFTFIYTPLSHVHFGWFNKPECKQTIASMMKYKMIAEMRGQQLMRFVFFWNRGHPIFKIPNRIWLCLGVENFTILTRVNMQNNYVIERFRIRHVVSIQYWNKALYGDLMHSLFFQKQFGFIRFVLSKNPIYKNIWAEYNHRFDCHF